MKRNIFLFLLLFVSLSVYSQISRRGLYGEIGFRAFSVGVSGGATYYYGDVEMPTDNFFDKKSQVGYFVEGNFSYSFWEYMSLRFNTIYGQLSGEREGYSFKSDFVEPSLNLEYHPFTVVDRAKDLYLTLGFGSTFSNIRSQDTKILYEQKTSKIAPVMIVGLGYRYLFDNGLWIGAQLVSRMVLVDNENINLDAYPYSYEGKVERGLQSKFNDGYVMFGLTFGYQWSK